MVASASRRESTHAKWKGGRQWGYLVWAADLGQGAFYVLLYSDRERNAAILGLPSSSIGWFILLTTILLLSHGLTMSASSITLYRATGLEYAKDRHAFAVAGGFDVGHWPILLTHVGLYWALRLTVETRPDPLAWLRSWWVYVLVGLGIALVLTVLVGMVVFRRYKRRHPLTLLESLRGTLRPMEG